MPDGHLRVTKFKYSELNLWTPSHIHPPCPANGTQNLLLYLFPCKWTGTPYFQLLRFQTLRSCFVIYSIFPPYIPHQNFKNTFIIFFLQNMSRIRPLWGFHSYQLSPGLLLVSFLSDLTCHPALNPAAGVILLKSQIMPPLFKLCQCWKGLIQSGTGKAQNEPGTLCNIWKGSAQRLQGVCQKDNGGNSL